MTVKTQFTRLALFAALFVLVCAIVFLVNQTAQVVALSNAVSPAFGRIVLIGLLVAYALAVAVPVVMFIRLPKALRPPADEASPEYQRYLERLGARLAGNPHLAGAGAEPSDRAGIEAALKVLEAKAEELIKRTASALFVSTAISQNGRLDTVMVLAAQTRMVWQVAHVYNQRPSLREMIQLYANVAATAFLVSEIEDLDISEQVQPVITAALGGSMAGLAPGMNMVATIVTQSILEGTANAYLTLRICVICERYCAPLAAVDRSGMRRSASVRAAGMLGSIVSASSAVVAKAIVTAARKAGAATVGSAARGLRTFGARITHRILPRRRL